MNLTTLLLLFCFDAEPQPQTYEVDPRHERVSLHVKVHHFRPTLVVFNREPDANMITGDEKFWFVTTPAQGLPSHVFHFKPKTKQGGLVTNAHFLFGGYPLELVLHSVPDPVEAMPTVYVVIRGGEATETLDLPSGKPRIAAAGAQTPSTREQPVEATGFLRKFRSKKTRVGEVRWSREGPPTVVFKARPHMAKLTSFEIVRAKKKWGTRNSFHYAHPLARDAQAVGELQVLGFERVHLAKREHYYARLFFEGGREPVYVKLSGFKRR